MSLFKLGRNFSNMQEIYKSMNLSRWQKDSQAEDQNQVPVHFYF